MSLFNKVFGDPNEKLIKKVQPVVAEINAKEKELQKLTDEDLPKKTEELKNKIEKASDIDKALDEALPEAFALVKNACRRLKGRSWKVRDIDTEWFMVPFDEQLLGGVFLHRGYATEMKTGEGKTLVAVLAMFLNALAGRGTHLVTVNEYLAQRDSEWMGGVYEFLGLSVGVSLHGQDYKSKQEAYQADITYGTNNEFGFDYLRDNMVGDLGQRVQRSLFYAIVDEVDSILIDEARTPLIISSPAEESTDKYNKFSKLVKTLKENEHFNIDEKMRAATLTPKGITNIEKALGMENIYEEGGIPMVHHLEQALRAQALFQKDKDYVVKDGEIVIVDEFTGRMMPGRRYSEGLHQAIEAKEGVKVKQESRTMATITFQNYFRLYHKLSGMSGTVMTQAEEFEEVYGLESVVLPTHNPMVRADESDRIYKSERGKYQAITREIKERYKRKQPVLVGTISVEKSEVLSKYLESEGIPHEVLNAKHHEREAKIVENAGQPGAVTIATNMAGRGTDIKLGEGVQDTGGLYVVGTERHEARRIDDQLRGRAGRQGDPGESQFMVSMDDDLMRIFGSERMKSLMGTFGVPDDQPIQNKFISRSIESAQKKVEGNNYDVRKHLVEYDDVMNKQREVIYRRRREILLAWELVKEKHPELRLPTQSGDQRSDEEADEKTPSVKLTKDEARQLKAGKIETLKDRIGNILAEEISGLVDNHTVAEERSKWNIKEIVENMKTMLPIPNTLPDELKSIAAEKAEDEQVRQHLIDTLTELAAKAYELKEKEVGEIGMRQIERAVLLRTIDTLWLEHLETMDYLREGVRLRGYGQRDPLVEYKKEGLGQFDKLIGTIQSQVAFSVFKVGLAQPRRSPMETARRREQGVEGKSVKEKQEKSDKVGRNDPCTCGSGKKYKKCCGRNQ